MKHFRSVFLLGITIAVLSLPAFAQENDTKVIDEVVAQVNDGVITLSRVKREMKGVVDSYVQQGKNRDEAQKMVDEKRGELIANLINEELLVQKAKDLGIDSDIEASLNARFVQIMKQYNLKTLDSLYAEMNKQGIDPQDMREVWKLQATKEEVIRREVQSKLYWQPSGKEIKDYFEKNKAKFGKPETVTLSEIFLSFAGSSEAVVREKALQIIVKARGGADFPTLVAENSDNQDKAQTKGSVGTLNVKDLTESIGKAVAGVKVGGVAEPVEDEVGIHIIRVDDRSAASSESQFDENAVRTAILAEKAPAEQKKYMAKLREDSYIKISDTYRPLVAPILFEDERTSKTTSN